MTETLQLIMQMPGLSRSDIEKGLKFPSVSPDLAYFCGLLAGDGCLYSRKGKDYEVYCGGNPHNETEFYDDIIKKLLKNCFGLSYEMRLLGNRSTYGFIIYSKALYSFLTENIGLPSGKKHPDLRIPACFNTVNLKLSFIRGLADTDFSLQIKNNRTKNNYPTIVGSSKTKEFIEEIAEILRSVGLDPHVRLNYSYFDSRYNKAYTLHKIELAGHRRLKQWMDLIGFSNPKYVARYEEYKSKRQIFLNRSKPFSSYAEVA